ncbi:glycosyltransferase family 4 protein [Dyella flava]|uniref:Glycosyltransferase family 4 protein n=1 Tax=Dyella flava TaxID=1920170 RepID=A0ABS2K1E2_9GAMM|nr:glycosyltransferase family 4 protein [Dyella flava]MBM7125054.1 glycosyltransferase family 4 protein [Dyella flava]GLQ51926.1 glycosyl transferase family 1 [Dyella flava]
MKFVFFANTDWYLYNFRLSTARRLQAEGHEVVMLSPPGEFGARFASQGFRWISLGMDRASLNPLRELLTVHALVRVLAEERPDVLHNFTLKCAVYGALAARLAHILATVNAVAGLGFVFTSDSAKARVLRPLLKLMLRATLGSKRSLLILQNPDDASAFLDARLIGAEKIRVIRSSGVNTARFHPVYRHEQNEHGRLRVLMASRLLWEKGVKEFVDASSLLHAAGRDIEFVIAGTPDSGNPHAVAAAEMQNWTDAGLVRWLGHVDDMPALLNSVDVMVLPSYYREGVPKCLIEGAACGLALITTDRPGCREVVSQDGIDGLRVEVRNARDLAEKITRLDDDRELLSKLGLRARQKALAHFDERRVIQQTLDVYDELLYPGALKHAPEAPASRARRTVISQ